jgi:hypothetical protein
LTGFHRPRIASSNRGPDRRARTARTSPIENQEDGIMQASWSRALARNAWRRWGLGSLMAIGLMAAPAALGQGTSRMLPAPISSKELGDYARLLGLSEAQRNAVDPFHEQYKNSFRELRDGPIQTFLDEQGALGLGFVRASRDDIARRIESQRQLLARIESLDRRLLDQVGTVLSDEQLGALARVRMARERARDQGVGMMMWNPAAHVDLARLALEADWPGPDRRAAEPILVPYEQRLTRLLGDLNALSMSAPLDMHDAMARAGVDPARFAEAADLEPAERETMFTAVENARRDIEGRTLAAAAEITRLNRTTFRALRGAVSETTALALKDAFYRRAYFEAWPDPGWLLPRFEKALKLPDLSAEARAQVETLRSDYLARHESATEPMIERLDEMRSSTSFFGWDRETRSEHEAAMSELRDRRAQINTGTADALRAIVGEKAAAALAEAPPPGPAGGRGMRSIAIGGDGAPLPMGGEIIATSPGPGMVAVSITTTEGGPGGPGAADSTGDPFVPPPISHRDVEAYARMLKLDEDGRAVLEALHEEYDRQVRGATEPDLGPLREMNDRLRPGPPQEGRPRPTLEQVDEVFVTRSELVRRVRALDEALFRDIEAALVESGGSGSDSGSDSGGAAAAQRIRWARQRAVSNRGGGGGPMMLMAGVTSREASVDVAEVISGLELPETERAGLDAALLEYERNVTPAMQTRFDKSLEARQAMERMHAARMNDDGSIIIDSDDDEFMQAMHRARTLVRESSDAVSAINRDHLARLMSALPPASAERLRVAYNRRAFPSVYADPEAVEPKLRAAARLPDLSSEQRERVQMLLSEYTSSYQGVCDRMTEIEARSGRGISMAGTTVMIDGEQLKAMQERQNAMGKLRFERQELNASTLRRLRELLTAEQFEKVAPPA